MKFKKLYKLLVSSKIGTTRKIIAKKDLVVILTFNRINQLIKIEEFVPVELARQILLIRKNPFSGQ